MSNFDITPLPAQALVTDKQVRAYVHPTRMVILAALAREKQTVSGIARQLNVHPANITHHFKLLEKIGLIKLVEKRDTGKNLEKYYRAVAYNFTVNLDADRPIDKGTLALSVLRDNLSAAIHSLKTEGKDALVLGVLQTVYLRPEDVEQLQAGLANLLETYSAPRSESSTAYQINLSLYPGETGIQPTQEFIIGQED